MSIEEISDPAEVISCTTVPLFPARYRPEFETHFAALDSVDPSSSVLRAGQACRRYPLPRSADGRLMPRAGAPTGFGRDIMSDQAGILDSVTKNWLLASLKSRRVHA
jgi:hypothetical protein